jgi:hypothetical protein
MNSSAASIGGRFHCKPRAGSGAASVLQIYGLIHVVVSLCAAWTLPLRRITFQAAFIVGTIDK